MSSPSNLPAAAIPAEPAPRPFEALFEIPWGLRVTLLVGAVLGWGLLALAWGLAPDPRGYGTHEQLGMAPCGVVKLIGMRCPSCGMTTSFNRLAHGDLAGAMAANAGGAVMGIGWFLAAPWMAVCGARGKWWGFVPQDWHTLLAGCVILGITLVDWLVRLASV